MFGEKQIIGRENVKVNSKNQIKLPLFTGAEENDHLVVVRGEDSYIIINSSDYYNLIKQYELAKQNASQYRECKNIIRTLYSRIIDTSKCDSNLKITLPSEIKEKSLYCVGENKHLVLKK